MLLQLLMSLKLQETFWKQQQTVWTELSAEEQELKLKSKKTIEAINYIK
jgi:hypothetical protein